jgi:hypothetical protein
MIKCIIHCPDRLILFYRSTPGKRMKLTFFLPFILLSPEFSMHRFTHIYFVVRVLYTQMHNYLICLLQDCVAQTTVQFKYTLNLKCNLILFTFTVNFIEIYHPCKWYLPNNTGWETGQISRAADRRGIFV